MIYAYDIVQGPNGAQLVAHTDDTIYFTVGQSYRYRKNEEQMQCFQSKVVS